VILETPSISVKGRGHFEDSLMFDPRNVSQRTEEYLGNLNEGEKTGRVKHEKVPNYGGVRGTLLAKIGAQYRKARYQEKARSVAVFPAKRSQVATSNRRGWRHS
jgi:hypothetical protein